jgi:RNA polymerase sigma factor (sigma-70 family)
MASGQVGALFRQLRRLLGGGSAEPCADGQLLQNFLERRDEAAFAEIVRRHGPLVFRVCRNVLPNSEDAEDAFQATFLVLVRKARSLARPQLLGPWLHGVAYRIAVRARAQAARRRLHERQAPAMSPSLPADEIDWRELGPVFEEEVNRLPEKFRTAFALCYLEGKTTEEAGRLLGCPRGTVVSRLARARARLRGRLARRGLTLSAAGFAAALSRAAAPAAVPVALIETTVRGGLVSLAGVAAHAECSARAAVLAREVTQAMLLTKRNVGAALLLTVALFGVSLQAIGSGTPPAEAPAAPQKQAAPPAGGQAGKPQEVAEVLKKRVAEFSLEIRFHGNGEDRRLYPSVLLTVPPAWEGKGESETVVRLARARALALIDHLCDPRSPVRRVPPVLADDLPAFTYGLYVRPEEVKFPAIYVRFGPGLFEGLEGIRKVLDGKAAKALDTLLDAVEKRQKEWEKVVNPVRQQTSDWGLVQGGLLLRVTAPGALEQGMPLAANVELAPGPAKIPFTGRQLNTFLPAAYLELRLTKRGAAPGKPPVVVRPDDPTRGMLAVDNGTSAVVLDGKPIEPWHVVFPLLRKRKELDPGTYDCEVRYTFPAKRTVWWQGTDEDWTKAGFWHGTLTSGRFPVEIKHESRTKRLFRLPTRLRLAKGLTVTYAREDSERVLLAPRNGYFLGTQFSLAKGGYSLRGGVPAPGDTVATWSDYKSGDRTVTYTVEVFETVDPPGHLWHPRRDGDHGRVLWRRTFTFSLTEAEIRKRQ